MVQETPSHTWCVFSVQAIAKLQRDPELEDPDYKWGIRLDLQEMMQYNKNKIKSRKSRIYFLDADIKKHQVAMAALQS